MTLTEALEKFPADMKMKSHVDGEVKTVAEWLISERNDRAENFAIGAVKYNYGKTVLRNIYYPGIGIVLSET